MAVKKIEEQKGAGHNQPQIFQEKQLNNTKAKVGEKELEKLLEGNRRFVKGDYKGDRTPLRREEVAEGQKPFAIVITCSDSRTPPEHIFDAGIGDIFVIRTAGNVVDAITIGSVEYAAEHLNVPLVVVMGHSKCGAVTAASAEGHVHGNIGEIIKAIKPAVEMAKTSNPENVIEEAVKINARITSDSLITKSELLAELEKKGKLKIVTAKYELDTGEVGVI